MLTIREIRLSDRDKFNSFAQRYQDECGGEVVPFMLNPDCLPYGEFYDKLASLSRREALPEGWVPAKYYLIWKDGRIVGAVNIRYEDSDFILNYAGHIGYGIAPWERRRGYMSAALKLSLPIAKSLGLSRVLLTCDLDNEASRRVIIKNGGKFERRDDKKEFYWIGL